MIVLHLCNPSIRQSKPVVWIASTADEPAVEASPQEAAEPAAALIVEEGKIWEERILPFSYFML